MLRVEVIRMWRREISPDEVASKYKSLRKELVGYQMHIKHLISAIDRKMERFKERIGYYYKIGEPRFATIYHNETRNLMIIKKILLSISNGLEAVYLRLDTMGTVLPALLHVKSSVRAIRDVVDKVRVVDDGFSESYKVFMDNFMDLDFMLDVPDIDLARFLELDTSAEEIIKTVERKIGEELSKIYPSVPKNLDEILSSNPKQGVKKLYEVLATDGGYVAGDRGSVRAISNRVIEPTILRVNHEKIKSIRMRNVLDRTDTLILRYIINVKRGVFSYQDIYKVARIARASPEYILDRLYKLAEDGYIYFLRGM